MESSMFVYTNKVWVHVHLRLCNAQEVGNKGENLDHANVPLKAEGVIYEWTCLGYAVSYML